MLNVKNSDMIGKNIVIKNSSDRTKIGKKGLVIYQTKETLKIRDDNNKIFEIKQNEIINLEIKWKIMEKTCLDKNCPVHGQISVRGKSLQGIVVKKKALKTAVIQMEKIKYIRKYERYMKKTVKLPVHCPECMDINIGDIVLVGETRKLSKTKSVVILKKLGKVSHMEDIIEDEDKYEGIENEEGEEEWSQSVQMLQEDFN